MDRKGLSKEHTEVTSNGSEIVDNVLQMEQHLYRKHLHIRHLGELMGMLIFPITFISFSLEAGNWPAEGTRIAAYPEGKEI